MRKTSLLLLDKSLEDRIAPILLQSCCQVHLFEDLAVVTDLFQSARYDLWGLQDDTANSGTLRVCDLGPDARNQADQKEIFDIEFLLVRLKPNEVLTQPILSLFIVL